MLQTILLKDQIMPVSGRLTIIRRSLIGLLVFCTSFAHGLTIQVVDKDGQPFAGAVVELQNPDLTADPTPSQAAMDQVDKQFKPHILAVQQGTPVIFPNSDSIKHHVYSFSAAKRFQLKLYKEQQPDPLILDKPGIVALGCNVHDWMVGYIYVSRSAQFGRSDENGLVKFDVPTASYQLKVWHPRFQAADMNRQEQVDSSTEGEITYRLQLPLHPKLEDEADEFDVY